MCDQRRSNKCYKSLGLSLFFASFLISCSSTPSHKGSSFDLSQVNKMAFSFESNSEFLATALPQADISKKVTSNLSEWGYQFIGHGTSDYTHDLSIHIGSIRRGATPVGFSFSSGNPDPRALEFQKATILPLTCSLMPKGQSLQRADLVMEVMAEEYKGSNIVSVSEQQMISRLTDDISTTCFNLLDSLNIKTLQNESSSGAKIIRPTWVPKIRIEIENIAETDSPNKKLNNKKISPEPRKRIIIHNQGTPVIFKFGPDR